MKKEKDSFSKGNWTKNTTEESAPLILHNFGITIKLMPHLLQLDRIDPTNNNLVKKIVPTDTLMKNPTCNSTWLEATSTICQATPTNQNELGAPPWPDGEEATAELESLAMSSRRKQRHEYRQARPSKEDFDMQIKYGRRKGQKRTPPRRV